MKQFNFILLMLVEFILISMLVIRFDNVIKIIKGIIYLQILIYTSYFDYKVRIIPDKIHILILVVALIQIDLSSSILNLFVFFVPFYATAIIEYRLLKRCMGGGDIKYMASNGFFLGFKGTEPIIIIIGSLILSLIINCKSHKKEIALAPYLSIACYLAYLI
ncbi:prepilin peptidase [Clostridioides difficile]|nr:A24 family peptidase [Clostridioides difficile]